MPASSGRLGLTRHARGCSTSAVTTAGRTAGSQEGNLQGSVRGMGLLRDENGNANRERRRRRGRPAGDMFSAFGSSMAPRSSPAACRSSPSFALGQRRPPRRHPSTDLEPGELPSADAYQPASTVVLAGTDDEPARMRFVIALTVEGLSLSDADLRAAIVEGLTRRFKHRCRPGHQRTACRRPGTLTGREGCRDGAVAAELAVLWPASSYTVMVMVHLPDELAERLSAETARRRRGHR